MKTSHWVQLTVTAIAAALAPVQQYTIGMPAWTHAILLSILAVLTALGIPGIAAIVNELGPAPAPAPLPPPSDGATVRPPAPVTAGG